MTINYPPFAILLRGCPNDCVLLVDTYNMLKSGLQNPIKIAKAKAMEARRSKAQRNSEANGDLTYLAKKSRQMLDDAS